MLNNVNMTVKGCHVWTVRVDLVRSTATTIRWLSSWLRQFVQFLVDWGWLSPVTWCNSLLLEVGSCCQDGNSSESKRDSILRRLSLPSNRSADKCVPRLRLMIILTAPNLTTQSLMHKVSRAAASLLISAELFPVALVLFLWEMWIHSRSAGESASWCRSCRKALLKHSCNLISFLNKSRLPRKNAATPSCSPGLLCPSRWSNILQHKVMASAALSRSCCLIVVATRHYPNILTSNDATKTDIEWTNHTY